MSAIESTVIIPRLHQGSKPPIGSAVARDKFDLLVLSAKEYQPGATSFPGVVVLHAPLDDHPITEDEWRRAINAAEHVARAHQQGAKVLVTCMMGLNRSGLITALALHMLTGMSGGSAERLIRSKRRLALFNPSFVKMLRAIRART